MRKVVSTFFFLFVVYSLLSQNTGTSQNTWYKINSRGTYITKIKVAGDYAQHEAVVHIINNYWNTAEVQYISEFNYNHKRIKLEWGFLGSGASRYMAVRMVPITANYASSFTFTDVIDPNFDYGLEAIDPSLVTPISPKKQIFIDEWTGNIGINTISPDEKLSVNGNIHTKEVRVDLSGWSDFVFDTDYNLPTLQEVEKHIKENGHLQDIPSAEEVEEKGILLGDMNAKLLQKIEELTLYAIQQQKLIEEQSGALKAQAETNSELKDRLSILEEVIDTLQRKTK